MSAISGSMRRSDRMCHAKPFAGILQDRPASVAPYTLTAVRLPSLARNRVRPRPSAVGMTPRMPENGVRSLPAPCGATSLLRQAAASSQGDETPRSGGIGIPSRGSEQDLASRASSSLAPNHLNRFHDDVITVLKEILGVHGGTGVGNLNGFGVKTRANHISFRLRQGNFGLVPGLFERRSSCVHKRF